MSTYTICLSGSYYACGMDLFCSVVYSLTDNRKIENIQTVAARNKAIKEICKPLRAKEALQLARRSGNYIGQLYSYEHYIMEV